MGGEGKHGGEQTRAGEKAVANPKCMLKLEAERLDLRLVVPL